MTTQSNHSLIPSAFFSQLCGLIAAGLGVVAIAGWLTGWRILSGIRADYIPMAPNTALSFIVLGISLFALLTERRWGLKLSRIGVTVVFALSLIRFAEFSVNINLNVDRWIFQVSSEKFGLIPVGQMALPTALNFLFASVALFLASSLKKHWIAGGVERLLSGTTTLIGFAFSLGYIYSAPLLYGGTTIPMALNTAISFFVLGLGLVINNLSHDIAERKRSAEALRKAYDELEVRVAERTAELAKTNETSRAEIIERRHAEEALRESENKFRDLSEKSIVGVYLIQDGVFKYANPRLAEIFGYAVEELIDKKGPKDLVLPEDWHIVEENLRKRISGEVESIHYDFKGITKNKETIYVEVYGSKTVYRGRPAVIGTLLGITERKKFEEQLRHAQKMEAIGQLVGGIAHDFNNMLNAIIGFGDLMQMNMKKDDLNRGHLKEILKAGERAAHLTQSLLAFSRKQIIDPKPQNLNEIIKGVEKFLMKIIGEDIELKVKGGEGGFGDLTVFADRGQIEQVLMNLATNARDAMPDGGDLIMETEVIQMDEEYIKNHGYGESGTYALLAVTDSGTGMDEATRQRIFEPFFTTKELGRGTGLGLAMVYGIVKQHNGYINVYSEPQKGTTFKIYLPLIKSEAAESVGITPDVYPKGGTETVLVAEDDRAVRKLTRSILERFGYKVIMVEDGEDAIEKFMENKEEIQLLLLDVIMPKKNGKEVYEEIKKINPGIKTLFLS
ncbi:MAG: PAS domain S-box protein [Nitrospinae bacterium]|nr:PAS domain S-box protein [Nitrospinota bacterium]